jgi:hypothetical protein
MKPDTTRLSILPGNDATNGGAGQLPASPQMAVLASWRYRHKWGFFQDAGLFKAVQLPKVVPGFSMGCRFLP